MTIDKDGVTIPVSLDRVNKMLQVSYDAERIAGLYNSMGQLESGTQRVREEISSPLAD